MKKEDILILLKQVIGNFPNIKKFQLIAVFGSFANNLNEDLTKDIDLITITNKKSHDKFISYLRRSFLVNGIKVVFFDTILKQAKFQDKKIILIHDLYYPTKQILEKKEWKTVIDSMKSDMFVLYGDEKFPKKIKLNRISKKEITNPLYKWAKKIHSKKDFLFFRKHLLKIIPRFLKRYSYLRLRNLSQIKKLLVKKIFWKEQLKQTTFLLKSS